MIFASRSLSPSLHPPRDPASRRGHCRAAHRSLHPRCRLHPHRRRQWRDMMISFGSYIPSLSPFCAENFQRAAPLFLSASRCGPMNGSECPTLGFLPMGVTIGRAPPSGPGRGGRRARGTCSVNRQVAPNGLTMASQWPHNGHLYFHKWPLQSVLFKILYIFNFLFKNTRKGGPLVKTQVAIVRPL